MIEHVYLIPLIPLVMSFIILLGAKEDPHSPMPFLGIAATGWCLIHSLILFHGAVTGAISLPYEANWSWFTFGATVAGKPFAYDLPIGVLIDGPPNAHLVRGHRAPTWLTRLDQTLARHGLVPRRLRAIND